MPLTNLPPDQQIRDLAAEILSRQPYAAWRTQHSFEWLRSLFDRLGGFLRGDQPLALALLIAIAAALFAHLAYSLFTALRRPGGAAEDIPPAPRAEPLRGAHEAALRGNFLEAARLAQLACLHLMIERGWLDLRRFEANTALRARVRESPLPPALRRDVLPLIDRFEQAWFRDRRADRGLYQQWCDLHARLALLRGRPS